MPDFLACYDYGTGGVWLYVEGDNPAQVKKLYPALTVFEAPPSWWNVALKPDQNSRNPFWADWLKHLPK
jgi:hypothetical protein